MKAEIKAIKFMKILEERGGFVNQYLDLTDSVIHYDKPATHDELKSKMRIMKVVKP